MKNAWLGFAVALLLAAGCTQSDLHSQIADLTGELRTSNFSLNSSYDMVNYSNGTCTAMMCKNKTPSFPFNLFFDSSMKGGNCSFLPCNYSDYKAIAIDGSVEDTYIRHFMFGAGHSLYSFSEANVFCNNSMRLAVKWLVGSNYSAYPVPDKERTECFLDKNVLPVYILYSNGTDINATRAEQIAKNLSGAGPVIIVSEAELDDSNISRYQLVKNQVTAMKQHCEKCIIALGLKLNGTSEYNVTRELFSDASFAAKVDIVAYGLNSHNFRECNPDKAIWYAVNFSKMSMRNYSKPSLISYALFDAANSSDNSCKWTNESVGNAYSELYAYVGTLAGNGIIGVSLYSLYGMGPLGCEDCALLNPNFGTGVCANLFNPQKAEPRFTNFMGFCQAYYNGIGENISGLMPLVYSNGSQECNFAFNSNILRYLNISDSGTRPLVPYEIRDNEPFYTCAGCFGNGTIPTNFTSFSGSQSYCTDYAPWVEIAADNFDMDPVLLRAAVWQESGFQKCAVSYVPASNPDCNPLNLDTIADPAGCCIFMDEDWAADPASTNPISPCVIGGTGEQCKPCAYGLAQVTDYPDYVYEANPSLPIPDSVKACAAGIKDGYPDFNPFRPYDSPCAYAYKFMKEELPAAQVTVANNAVKLNVGSDANKREWYAVFFALDLIFGHQGKPACHAPTETQQDWIDHFYFQKDRVDCATNPVTCLGEAIPNPACCGNKDFLNFTKFCEHNGSFSYAYDVLAKYDWLSKNCDEAACPETGKNSIADENIMEYLCENGYVAGAPGISDCCPYAQTVFGYSAWWFCYFNPGTPASCKTEYCA